MEKHRGEGLLISHQRYRGADKCRREIENIDPTNHHAEHCAIILDARKAAKTD